MQQSFDGMDVEITSKADQTHAAARLAFSAVLDDMPFSAEYEMLIEMGWGWRKAAYIAWRALPKDVRHPATLQELANILGCSTSAILRWRRKNTAIDATVSTMSARLIFDAMPEIMDALIDSASNPDYRHAPDRRVALQMSGAYVDKTAVQLDAGTGNDDMAALSEDELRRLAASVDGGDDSG